MKWLCSYINENVENNPWLFHSSWWPTTKKKNLLKLNRLFRPCVAFHRLKKKTKKHTELILILSISCFWSKILDSMSLLKSVCWCVFSLSSFVLVTHAHVVGKVCFILSKTLNKKIISFHVLIHLFRYLI